MESYFILKFLHIFSVIIAVGFNFSYGFIIQKSRKTPENALFALRLTKFMDDYIANPCYGIATLTGLGMVWLLDYSFSIFWIWSSLSLFSLMGILAIFYTPLSGKAIKIAEKEGMDSPAFKAIESKVNRLGWALLVLVLAIIWLMVRKPIW
jgi:uncharacterized membrane protein